MTPRAAPQNSARPQGLLSQRALHLIFLLTFAAMLWPVLYNRYPLSADYLNHLSRVFILYHRHDPFLRRIFRVHFGIVPNMGLDALAYALRPLGLGANITMKLIFALSCIALWSGAIAFTKSVHGRVPTSSLLILPISYSFILAYGFYDFMLGMGLVLWCFVWLLRAKPSLRTSLIVVNCVSALIFFCHFGAWLILIACLFLYRAGAGQNWRRSIVVAIGENILPSILYFLRVKNHFDTLLFDSLPYKVDGFIAAFQMTSFAYAFCTAVIFCALLAALLHIRAIRIPRMWTPLLIGLGALSMLAPFDLQASYFVDWRLIWTTCLFLIMTVEITPIRRWIEPLIFGSVALMLIPNMTALARDTHKYNETVDQFARAIRVIPRNSFVFVSTYERKACAARAPSARATAHQDTHDQPGKPLPFMFYRGIPALLVPDRNSVYPYIFAQRGAEAVYVRPAFSGFFSPMPRSPLDSLMAALLVTGNDIPLHWKNGVLDDGSDLSQPPFSLAPFMDKWDHRFSYVIHLQSGCPGAGPYARLFKQVAHGNFFTIYKVTRSPDTNDANAMSADIPRRAQRNRLSRIDSAPRLP